MSGGKESDARVQVYPRGEPEERSVTRGIPELPKTASGATGNKSSVQEVDRLEPPLKKRREKKRDDRKTLDRNRTAANPGQKIRTPSAGASYQKGAISVAEKKPLAANFSLIERMAGADKPDRPVPDKRWVPRH